MQIISYLEATGSSEPNPYRIWGEEEDDINGHLLARIQVLEAYETFSDQQWKTKAKDLSDEYGISLSQYIWLVRSKGGVAQPVYVVYALFLRTKTANVDHNWAIGKGNPAAVRGLLCWGCNLVIGQIGDNIEAI